MATPFKQYNGSWTDLERPDSDRLDFHKGTSDGAIPYHERMNATRTETLEALAKAQGSNCSWLLVTHGSSTSGAF